MPYADPTRCPDCGHLLEGRTTCPYCRLRLDLPAAGQLFAALTAADRHLAHLRAHRAPVEQLVGASVGAPASASPPLSPTPPASRPEPAPQPLHVVGAASSPGPRRARRGLSGASVPTLLLGLSVLMLLVGATVFMAVTWTRLGVGAQTAILLTVTAAAAAGSTVTRRRGLRAGAEALAAVAAGLAGLDALGAVDAGWLGAGLPTGVVAAIVSGAVAVTGLALLLVQRRDGRSRDVDDEPSRLLVTAQLAASVGLLVAGLSLAAESDHALVAVAGLVLVAAVLSAVSRLGRALVAHGVLLVSAALLALGAGFDAVAALAASPTYGDWLTGPGLALVLVAAAAAVLASGPGQPRAVAPPAALVGLVYAVPALTGPVLADTVVAFALTCAVAALVLVAVRLVLERRVPDAPWTGAALGAAACWWLAAAAPAGLGTLAVLVSWVLDSGGSWVAPPTADLADAVALPELAGTGDRLLLLALVPLLLGAAAGAATLGRLLTPRAVAVRSAIGAAVLLPLPLTALAMLEAAPVWAVAGCWALGAVVLVASPLLTRRTPWWVAAGTAQVASVLAVLLAQPSVGVTGGVALVWLLASLLPLLIRVGRTGPRAGWQRWLLVPAALAALLVSLAVVSEQAPLPASATLAVALLVVAGLDLAVTLPGAEDRRTPAWVTGLVATGLLALTGSVVSADAGHGPVVLTLVGWAMVALAVTAVALDPQEGEAGASRRPAPLVLLGLGLAALPLLGHAFVLGVSLLATPWLSEGLGGRLVAATAETRVADLLFVPVAVTALLGALSVRSGVREAWRRTGTLVLAVVGVTVVVGVLAPGAPRALVVALVVVAAGVALAAGGRAVPGGLTLVAVAAAGSSQLLLALTLTAVAALAGAGLVRALVPGLVPGAPRSPSRATTATDLAAALLPAGVGAVLTWWAVADLPAHWAAVLPLVLVAGAVAVGARLGRLSPVVELAGALAAVAAVGYALSGPVGTAYDPVLLNVCSAVYLALGGVVLTAHALAHPARRVLGWVASVMLAGSTWLRLLDAGVDVPEAYTLPSALALLAFGAWRLRTEPGLGTTRALGSGLALALTPSLLLALDEPLTLRALLLGVAAVAVLLAGVRLRWAAPVAAGGGTAALLALRGWRRGSGLGRSGYRSSWAGSSSGSSP